MVYSVLPLPLLPWAVGGRQEIPGTPGQAAGEKQPVLIPLSVGLLRRSDGSDVPLSSVLNGEVMQTLPEGTTTAVLRLHKVSYVCLWCATGAPLAVLQSLWSTVVCISAFLFAPSTLPFASAARFCKQKVGHVFSPFLWTCGSGLTFAGTAPCRPAFLCRRSRSSPSPASRRPVVPSLLRGFSAPVRLQSDLTRGDQLFLLAHDSDDFNRWVYRGYQGA